MALNDVFESFLSNLRWHYEVVRDAFISVCDQIDFIFYGMPIWQVVLVSAGITLVLSWLFEFIFLQEDDLRSRIIQMLFRVVKRIPLIRKRVEEEIEKTYDSLQRNFDEANKGQSYVERLPEEGLSEEDIMKSVKIYKQLDEVNWKSGACSGTVYNPDDQLTQLVTKVYGEFAWTNPLHSDVFPDVRKMEAEVVRMTCNMFGGGPNSCGCMTSGGTESIMLACKAYRDLAYERGITHPEMIVPVTAHAAFDKAASYFRIRIIHVWVDGESRKAKSKLIRKAITRNTCMLVGSAPQFPHGIIDPIPEIAELGLKHGIPVHVDCCLGGFLLPFMAQAGYEVEPFGFTVPGVTSISADTHKYGFAPKGSSVIMYSDKSYRSHQFFVTTDWPGGIYASPTFAGSRSGAIIAGCWATMMHFGEKGYVGTTKRIIETTRFIIQGLREIKEIFIYGDPQISVIGIGSNVFEIYRLSDSMTKKGWNLNALQFPSSIHLCVTMVHTQPGVAQRFLDDVTRCVSDIMVDCKAPCTGKGAMYGLAQGIPDRSIVAIMARLFFDAYYSTSQSKSANKEQKKMT